MPVAINWRLNVSATAGPQLSTNTDLEMDAYDQVEVVIPMDGQVPVEVQPGGTEKVYLLIIQSSEYGAELKYNVDGTTEEVLLDQPHVLSGTGAIGLLAAAPKTLVFTNGLETDVTISIFAGRKA